MGVARSVPLYPPAPTPVTGVQRGGLCFSSLRKVLDDASYDAATGLPKWDCYTVYFATLDEPDGKLSRILLRDPTPFDVQSVPLALGPGDLSLANPNLLGSQVKVLSSHVMDFGVTLDQANQLPALPEPETSAIMPDSPLLLEPGQSYE